MSDVTVEQFAEVLKVTVDRLLAQLEEAGITVSGPKDRISEDAKHELLTHLRKSHGKAEDGGHATGDTGVAGLLVRKDTNAVLTSADGDYVMEAGDNYGAAFARVDHPNRILCTVTVSTATTLTAVGGSCAAPGTGLSIYITDILFASSAQAIIADTFPTLKYGTGGTCGSGTTAFWGAFQAAAVPATTVQSLKTPIKIPANNEVCWINSTVGSKFVVIAGFIAP